MKILVLQLARYGDLLMTVPTLQAIRRKYPKAKIHLLVREKFRQAVDHLDCLDAIWRLDSRFLLEPTILDHNRVTESIRRTTDFVDALASQGFDQVINLSFSPLSSYICDAVSFEGTDVKGYTRFSDGSLSIPDDTSAYFYGQVGIGRSNRVHLGEIFAAVAEVENTPQDWKLNLLYDRSIESLRKEFAIKDDYILIHVGASEVSKRYAPFKWAQVIRGLRGNYFGSIVLIGSPDEQVLAEEIEKTSQVSRPVNIVGKTKVREILPLIASAELLIGCDSLPMQAASLLGTPCLNLSFSSVNFWETGPRAKGSRVLYADSEVDLTSDRVIREAIAMLQGDETGLPVVLRTEGDIIGFEPTGGLVIDDYQFDLIEALYMDGEFPEPRNVEEQLVYERLFEITIVALEQLDCVLDERTRETAVDILGQLDQLIVNIERMVPTMFPLISWFQTERLRIGPEALETVVEKTRILFTKLRLICSLFVESEEMVSGAPTSNEVNHANQEMVK